jgi:hypothetical protein
MAPEDQLDLGESVIEDSATALSINGYWNKEHRMSIGGSRFPATWLLYRGKVRSAYRGYTLERLGKGYGGGALPRERVNR